jgi:hypothetical protein
MRRVFGRTVGAVSCVLVAACGGGAMQSIDPVTFVALELDLPTTHAPQLVAIDGDHAEAIRMCDAAARAVVESQEFALALSAIGPLAVAPDAEAAADVTGVDVVTRAFSTAAAARISFRTSRRCSSANASTALSTINGARGATITLFPATVDRLSVTQRENTACVINTLVHEWTHVARDGTDFAYVDTGRGPTARPLVSYTAGAVAQCVYLASRYREDVGAPGGFAMERCIAAAAAIPFDAETCVAGWGEQFVRGEREALW